ncbi:MAG: pantoate--beta-alanine ligase [Dongiaceae bacterium]
MANAIVTLRHVAELRERVSQWRKAGERIGLVPTMGALHDGHLRLVRRALIDCPRVIVTLFVNPRQFSASEDLSNYPRDESADHDLLAPLKVELLFAPTLEEIYPPGFATTVTVSDLSKNLCGPHRPGHFAGVTTIVAKLLLQAQPDAAYFGEKDFQQLQIIRRLVRDLDVPVEIVGVPTVRDDDGLALSSRNRYLSPAERVAATALPRTLEAIARRLKASPDGVAPALAWGRTELTRAGFAKIDYIEVCDADTLQPASSASSNARVFAAAWIGRTRLIDNMPI